MLPDDTNERTLFVGNLPFSATEDELMELFAGASSVRLPTYADSGKPRGIAFVAFDSPDDAKAALAANEGAELGGRALNLSMAGDKSKAGGGRQQNNRSFGGGGGGGGGTCCLYDASGCFWLC